jgi:hypothetical protein
MVPRQNSGSLTEAAIALLQLRFSLRNMGQQQHQRQQGVLALKLMSVK